MSEQRTVTQEELQELKAVRDAIDSQIITLGQIEYQKTLLNLQKDAIKELIVKAKEKEKEVSDRLIQKYGNVTVDIETGIIS